MAGNSVSGLATGLYIRWAGWPGLATVHSTQASWVGPTVHIPGWAGPAGTQNRIGQDVVVVEAMMFT